MPAPSSSITNSDIARNFDINDIDGAFLNDPFPTYRALREHDPLHRNPDGSWFLTRYADVARVYKDPTMSSDKKREFRPKFGDGALYRHHTTSLVFNDPPYHTRVRKLVAAAFTPRALGALAPRIDAVVEGLLDHAADKGEIDLIDEFGIVVPTEIIGDMLGVPHGERHRLRGWSMKILGALDPVTPPPVIEAGNRAVEEFSAFLADIIEQRRRRPESAGEGEVLQALIEGDADGERLTPDELIHNCIFILNGGHETTTSLIGHAVHLLLENPDELARLRADPGLIDSAIEEFMRYESPVQIGNRRTTEDRDFGGVTIPAGSYLHTSIGGANRDPAEFPDPDRLDIGRVPNRHLAFIAGRHICLGNTLARMEGRTAIGKLVARFPLIEPLDPPHFFGRARFRGFDRYRVAVK